MKASELIKYLQDEINKGGDCEVLSWNDTYMKHLPIRDIKRIYEKDFDRNLEDLEDYIQNFNNINHNIVINAY